LDKQEAAKLLSLIKLSYPTAYRDIDLETANATVNMWQMSFPNVPYPIMEQAFSHFRMVSKFPPTVAEMVEELKHIHHQATEGALLASTMENHALVERYQQVMEITSMYTKPEELGGLRLDRLPALNGGGDYVGTSRNRLDRANRVSELDAAW
jgi:hypothetical protein